MTKANFKVDTRLTSLLGENYRSGSAQTSCNFLFAFLVASTPPANWPNKAISLFFSNRANNFIRHESFTIANDS